MADKLELQQGKTFNQVVRWGTGPIIYKPITGILNDAPVTITAVGHGVPEGWSVAITSVKGMSQINARKSPPAEDKDPYKSDWKQATVLDVDTLSLNLVNAADFDVYQGGGYVQYYTPVPLAGYTARLAIKDKVGGTEILKLTTENGGIVIDAVNFTVTIVITATQTAAITAAKGVFDLEMVSSTGVVTSIMSGTVTVQKEVTT